MKISKKFPAFGTGLASGVVTHVVSAFALAPFGMALAFGLGTGVMSGIVSSVTYTTARRETKKPVMQEKKGLREKIGDDAFREMDIADKTVPTYARIPTEEVRSRARDKAYRAALMVTLFGSTAGFITGMYHRHEMKKDVYQSPKKEILMEPKRDTLAVPYRF